MAVSDFQGFIKAADDKYPFFNIRHGYLSSGRETAGDSVASRRPATGGLAGQQFLDNGLFKAAQLVGPIPLTRNSTSFNG